MLLALSTGREVGIAVVGACFVVFALTSAMLIPRFRPNFPARALPMFVFVTFLFFVGMMTAIVVLGHESKEAKAGGESTTTASTGQTTTTPSAVQKVAVQETEFKITLPSTTLKAGSYEFDSKNVGKLGHDLVIKGNGVDTKTPIFNPGQTQTLKVTLKPGKYDFYCSVPGHKAAGMNVEVTVTGAAKPTSTTSTGQTTTTPSAVQKVAVQETEFKIALPSTTLKAGSYEFDSKNVGKLGHDLVIKGNGVDTKTPIFNPGQTQTLKVTLKPGKYDFYCSVPGHKQAGMNVTVTVT